jgi:glyoxylase-like metal-dependent hydrolase (beta-lactamase superfamily II)
MVADDGTRNFPNAQVYMTQVDYDFWMDDRRLGPPAEGSALTARKNLPPYRDRIIFIKDGQEILPGVQAMQTPGHTVGHTVFMITSGGKTICNIGDVAHHVVLFEHPKIEVAFDTDSKQGVQSRIKLFDLLAAQRIPLLVFHMAWPGLGHLGKNGDGFRYVPMPMQLAL